MAETMMTSWFQQQERHRARKLKRVIRAAFLEGIKVGAQGTFDYCSGYETDRQIWRKAKPYFSLFLEELKIGKIRI